MIDDACRVEARFRASTSLRTRSPDLPTPLLHSHSARTGFLTSTARGNSSRGCSRGPERGRRSVRLRRPRPKQPRRPARLRRSCRKPPHRGPAGRPHRVRHRRTRTGLRGGAAEPRRTGPGRPARSFSGGFAGRAWRAGLPDRALRACADAGLRADGSQDRLRCARCRRYAAGLHGARRRRPAPARAQTAASRQAHPARSSTRRNRCTPT